MTIPEANQNEGFQNKKSNSLLIVRFYYKLDTFSEKWMQKCLKIQEKKKHFNSKQSNGRSGSQTSKDQNLVFFPYPARISSHFYKYYLLCNNPQWQHDWSIKAASVTILAQNCPVTTSKTAFKSQLCILLTASNTPWYPL